MIGSFVKKQWRLIIGKPQELLILLAMPIILTAILSFSLRNFIIGESKPLKATVAFVHFGNEEEERERFKEAVDATDLPEGQKSFIKEWADRIRPIKSLKEDVFGRKNLKDAIRFQDFGGSKLEELKQSGKFTAIILVPENFHYNLFFEIFFRENTENHITILKNEEQSNAARMVEEIVKTFQRQFTARMVASRYGVDFSGDSREPVISGSLKMDNHKEPIQSFHYYTAAMSVMFVLFIASHMSTVFFEEKRNQVFNRILLANGTGKYYFAGMFLSALLLAFLQQMILYGAGALAFHLRFPHIGAFFLVILALSVAVSGISSLLTAMTFYVNSLSVANFFVSFLVMVMSFLGGSFIPVHMLSPLMKTIGQWTPNGAAMDAILKILQGFGWTEVSSQCIYLVLFGTLATLVAVICFPKRGLGS